MHFERDIGLRLSLNLTTAVANKAVVQSFELSHQNRSFIQ